MIDFLAELELPTIVVLTKADKLSRRSASERVHEIMQSLSLSDEQTIQFSSQSGEGRTELAEAVIALIEASGESK
jgi:GTP-binding protein